MNIRVLSAFLCVLGGTAFCAEETVKASSFGFKAEDATECLQAAIDSGARTVVIDKMDSDWIVRPIKLRSNLELVVGDDVTVRAKKGAFKQKRDSLFFAADKDNITIRGGKNSVLYMPKKDYQDPNQYILGEWRHTIDVDGCYNFTVKDLTLDGSGGDGIAIGRGYKRIDSKNIHVENVVMVNHHRLAMGVVAVDGMVVKNCQFLNTSGTAPECGVDLEPNYADESIANVRFEDCVFRGNKAAGAVLVLFHHKAGSPAVSCTFERCVMENNTRGFQVVEGTSRPCDISLIDCSVSAEGAEGLYFCSLEGGNDKISFKGCTVTTRAKSSSLVVFTENRTLNKPFGDIDFGDTRFSVEPTCPLFSVLEFPWGLSSGIVGNPTVTCDGKTQPVDLKELVKSHPIQPEELRSFQTLDFVSADYVLPENAIGETTPRIRLRRQGYFAQWLQPGVPVELHFQLDDATDTPLSCKVTVFDANGGMADQFEFNGREEKVYRLKAGTQRTMRLFKVQPYANTVTVRSSAPGQGFLADKRVHFYITPVELYFIVPKEATFVKLEAVGEEPVSVDVFNAKGEKVLSEPKPFRGTKILLVKREPTATDELWKVKTYNIGEDYHLRLGAPCCPIFFTSPKNVVSRR